MLLESTNHQTPAVGFREALLRGIAPDGGLYLPTAWPRVEPVELRAWRDLAFPDLAARLTHRLLATEFPPDVIERLVRDALDFPVPTVQVEDGRFVLELFHGPTLAFKDFGARFLARFFSYLLGEGDDRATILVATSGDTGSAVAQGFYRVPSVQVVVLYPAGRISPFQEAQLATLGENITAVRVPGTFDDCQRLVKTAFLDGRLAALRLSSANSINIGRLLPQAFYYFASYLKAARHVGEPVVFSVPSGNLGNLTAGVMAQRLGLPVHRFVAATNLNAVLPEYLETGTYRARSSIATISNAMDVGDPSNFPRLLELHHGTVAELRENLYGAAVSEEVTRGTIGAVYRRTGYILDPHGAVGWAAADRYAAASDHIEPTITLATAHPAKFAHAVGQEIGFEPELPGPYRGFLARPLLAEDLPGTSYEAFRALLSGISSQEM